MTNPDNIVRVRARNGGRASVYEANGWAQGFTSGLLEGNGVIQNTSADMNVLVGGSTAKPDVVLAENPSGYRIALDLVGQQAIAITAPATNSRISAIVAYTDDLSLQSTEDTVTGSPASCGLIVVNGTAGATPSEPTDAQIRTAITADGATGSQACYCVIATIEVESTTTVITNSLITMNNCELSGTGVVKANNIDFTTLNGKRVKTDELYSNGSATAGSIDTTSMDGYDYLYFLIKRTSNMGWTTGTINTTDFKNGNQYTFMTCSPDNSSRVFSIYGIAIQYESDTRIKITKNCDVAFNTSGIAGGPSTGGSLSINKIIGIKLVDGY